MSTPHPVPVEAVRPLRHRVLRPMQGADSVVYPRDGEALHLAIERDGEVVAAGSIGPDPYPGASGGQAGDWRVRGMATEPAMRSQGLGGAVLRALLEHARAQGATRVWCNARAGARQLYEREGFTAEGDVFEIVPIGLHYLMATRSTTKTSVSSGPMTPPAPRLP